jgi:predicted nucleotidyltransferase
MERAEVIARLSRHFAAHGEGIVCAYLFGSVARGTAGKGSDVDVALLLERDPPPTLAESKVGMESRLEAATRLPVDLVVLNGAPVELVHRVLRDGVLVHEADRSARVRFEVRARNEYFDLKPILDEYRRAGARQGRG